MPKVFLSQAIHAERLVSAGPSAPGVALRGWKALAARYQHGLPAAGIPVEAIARPETYQSPAARQVLGAGAGDWHLAIKPLSHLRPFHGLPNVFVCDWPYPELSRSIMGGIPFFDQVRLLAMADAVACCTDHTAAILRAAGIGRVLTWPPFIPSPAAAARIPAGAGGRFLCVVDADHLARQLGVTIEGFALAVVRHPALRLTILLQGGDGPALAALRQQAAFAPADAIAVIADGADAPAFARLLAEADFFLCTDAAPGLGLKLAEAALAGIPIVATLTGGTASILPPGGAVAIETMPTVLSGQHEPIGHHMPLTAHAAPREALCAAFLAAAAMPPAARAAMAATARQAAEARFGLPAFREGLARLALLGIPA